MNIIHNKQCKLVLSVTPEFVVDLHKAGSPCWWIFP